MKSDLFVITTRGGEYFLEPRNRNSSIDYIKISAAGTVIKHQSKFDGQINLDELAEINEVVRKVRLIETFNYRQLLHAFVDAECEVYGIRDAIMTLDAFGVTQEEIELVFGFDRDLIEDYLEE